MNYQQILHKTAEAFGLDEEKLNNISDHILTMIKESVEKGDPVTVRGFGRFYQHYTDGSRYYDRKGNLHIKRPRKRMEFKMSSILKDKWNK